MLPFTEMRLPGTRDDRPTLVLLHMFGVSRREWIEVGLALANRFRVITIDTPGFGEASAVEAFTVEAIAGEFRATLDKLKLDRWILTGHSMTGKIAAVLAGQNLPGLEKLVLLTPSPLCPEPIPDASRAKMLAQAEPTRAEAEAYLRDNSALPIPPEIFERTVADRLRANPAAWRAWLEQGTQEDWTERVGRLTLPTLVIAGEKDASLGPETARALVMPQYTDARLEVVAGCGHIVPLEAPERLAALLREFASG